MFLEVLKTAFFRSLWQAFVSAGLTYFTSKQLGMDDHAALIAAGVTFFGYIAMRGGAEGIYDGNRSRTGEVHNADVGSNTVTIQTSTPLAAAPPVVVLPNPPDAREPLTPPVVP